MGLREELLAETGPKTHVAELCGRAADELIIKEMVIAVRDREIEMLRDAFTWSLRHTSGKELRRMVGDLSDTSDLDEYLRAIKRARASKTKV
jgi:hypothetical protein